MDGEAPTLARGLLMASLRRIFAAVRAPLCRMQVSCRILLVAGALASLSVSAQVLEGRGSCRAGTPQGAWKLAAPDGTLRAIGAFAQGRRTGSFIFWNAAGVRVAHLPYEDDAMNGTLALWYETPVQNGEGQQRLEAVYAHGKLDGRKRSWHANGRLRGEYTYANDVLLDARAWDGRGDALPEAEARAQAKAELRAESAYYRTLDALVNQHRPCQESVDR